METWVGSKDAERAGMDAAHQIRKVIVEGTDPRALNAALAADSDLFSAAWQWLTAAERRQWKEMNK